MVKYKEIWVELDDYPYAISNHGNIKRLGNRKRIRFRRVFRLTPTRTHMGYGVFLYPLDPSRPKKWYRISTLVGKYFRPGNGKIIHKDGDDTNNHVLNITREGYKKNLKLSPETVEQIKRELNHHDQKYLWNKYCVNRKTIERIKKSSVGNEENKL